MLQNRAKDTSSKNSRPIKQIQEKRSFSDETLHTTTTEGEASSDKKELNHSYQHQKIYVHPLPKELTLSELEVRLTDYFQAYGKIIDLIVLSQESKGHYAYLTFGCDQTVIEIITRPHKIFGRKVNIDRAWQKMIDISQTPEYPMSEKLFIGGIPHMATKAELVESFSKYGKVVHLTLPQSSSSKNQGFAFLIVDSLGSAKTIMANKSNIFVRAKQLDIKPNKSRKTVNQKSKIESKDKKISNQSNIIQNNNFYAQGQTSSLQMSNKNDFGQCQAIKDRNQKTKSSYSKFNSIAVKEPAFFTRNPNDHN